MLATHHEELSASAPAESSSEQVYCFRDTYLMWM